MNMLIFYNKQTSWLLVGDNSWVPYMVICTMASILHLNSSKVKIVQVRGFSDDKTAPCFHHQSSEIVCVFFFKVSDEFGIQRLS